MTELKVYGTIEYNCFPVPVMQEPIRKVIGQQTEKTPNLYLMIWETRERQGLHFVWASDPINVLEQIKYYPLQVRHTILQIMPDQPMYSWGRRD